MAAFSVRLSIKRPNSLGSTIRRWCTVQGFETNVDDEDKLEKLRNRSGMPEHMRRRMEAHSRMPDDAIYMYELTKKHRRRLYAKFGQSSNIDPGIMWPTGEELAKIIEVEKQSELPLQESLQNVNMKRMEEETRVNERVKQIKMNMVKLEKWKADVLAKRDKKLAEINEQREKRERLIEEVRLFFGYRLEPRDPRFKEVLEKKEKEENKAAKEMKKKEKLAKEMARIATMTQQSLAGFTSVPKEEVQSDTKKKVQSDPPEIN